MPTLHILHSIYLRWFILVDMQREQLVFLDTFWYISCQELLSFISWCNSVAYLKQWRCSIIGASGAISGVLGIAAVSGNTRAYYWLALQIVFAVIGSISALPIAFTAHVGGFIAGVLITKGLVKLEQIRTKSRYFLQS